METIKGMKAMVLAAGVGSRLDPLTRILPKPLVPIANKPVMEHILTLLKKHHVETIISNVHHLPEQVPAYFGDGTRLGMSLQYKHEVELSGDAGGVRSCREFLQDGTFLVIMGDLITDADISYVVNQHKAKGAIATIALQKVADVRHFGVAVTDADGFIKGFQEKPSPEEAISDLASTGIYVLEPEVFDHMPAEGSFGFGRQLFPQLVEKGLPVLGVQVFGYWSDIGTMENYKASSFDALKGLIDVELPGPSSSQGHIDTTAKIAPGVEILGKAMIGRNTIIESGAVLKGNVIIGDDCYIKSGAHLEDSIVWNGTSVGISARIVDCILGHGISVADEVSLVGVVTNESVKRMTAIRTHDHRISHHAAHRPAGVR
ncbi:MAG TPA: NDP-sugar synthase [Drouetiella sp.]